MSQEEIANKVKKKKKKNNYTLALMSELETSDVVNAPAKKPKKNIIYLEVQNGKLYYKFKGNPEGILKENAQFGISLEFIEKLKKAVSGGKAELEKIISEELDNLVNYIASVSKKKKKLREVVIESVPTKAPLPPTENSGDELQTFNFGSPTNSVDNTPNNSPPASPTKPGSRSVNRDNTYDYPIVSPPDSPVGSTRYLGRGVGSDVITPTITASTSQSISANTVPSSSATSSSRDTQQFVFVDVEITEFNNQIKIRKEALEKHTHAAAPEKYNIYLSDTDIIFNESEIYISSKSELVSDSRSRDAFEKTTQYSFYYDKGKRDDERKEKISDNKKLDLETLDDNKKKTLFNLSSQNIHLLLNENDKAHEEALKEIERTLANQNVIPPQNKKSIAVDYVNKLEMIANVLAQNNISDFDKFMKLVAIRDEIAAMSPKKNNTTEPDSQEYDLINNFIEDTIANEKDSACKAKLAQANQAAQLLEKQRVQTIQSVSHLIDALKGYQEKYKNNPAWQKSKLKQYSENIENACNEFLKNSNKDVLLSNLVEIRGKIKEIEGEAAITLQNLLTHYTRSLITQAQQNQPPSRESLFLNFINQLEIYEHIKIEHTTVLGVDIKYGGISAARHDQVLDLKETTLKAWRDGQDPGVVLAKASHIRNERYLDSEESKLLKIIDKFSDDYVKSENNPQKKILKEALVKLSHALDKAEKDSTLSKYGIYLPGRKSLIASIREKVQSLLASINDSPEFECGVLSKLSDCRTQASKGKTIITNDKKFNDDVWEALNTCLDNIATKPAQKNALELLTDLDIYERNSPGYRDFIIGNKRAEHESRIRKIVKESFSGKQEAIWAAIQVSQAIKTEIDLEFTAKNKKNDSKLYTALSNSKYLKDFQQDNCIQLNTILTQNNPDIANTIFATLGTDPKKIQAVLGDKLETSLASLILKKSSELQEKQKKNQNKDPNQGQDQSENQEIIAFLKAIIAAGNINHQMTIIDGQATTEYDLLYPNLNQKDEFGNVADAFVKIGDTYSPNIKDDVEFIKEKVLVKIHNFIGTEIKEKGKSILNYAPLIKVLNEKIQDKELIARNLASCKKMFFARIVSQLELEFPLNLAVVEEINKETKELEKELSIEFKISKEDAEEIERKIGKQIREVYLTKALNDPKRFNDIAARWQDIVEEQVKNMPDFFKNSLTDTQINDFKKLLDGELNEFHKNYKITIEDKELSQSETFEYKAKEAIIAKLNDGKYEDIQQFIADGYVFKIGDTKYCNKEAVESEIIAFFENKSATVTNDKKYHEIWDNFPGLRSSLARVYQSGKYDELMQELSNSEASDTGLAEIEKSYERDKKFLSLAQQSDIEKAKKEYELRKEAIKVHVELLNLLGEQNEWTKDKNITLDYLQYLPQARKESLVKKLDKVYAELPLVNDKIISSQFCSLVKDLSETLKVSLSPLNNSLIDILKKALQQNGVKDINFENALTILLAIDEKELFITKLDEIIAKWADVLAESNDNETIEYFNSLIDVISEKLDQKYSDDYIAWLSLLNNDQEWNKKEEWNGYEKNKEKWLAAVSKLPEIQKDQVKLALERRYQKLINIQQDFSIEKNQIEALIELGKRTDFNILNNANEIIASVASASNVKLHKFNNALAILIAAKDKDPDQLKTCYASIKNIYAQYAIALREKNNEKIKNLKQFIEIAEKQFPDKYPKTFCKLLEVVNKDDDWKDGAAAVLKDIDSLNIIDAVTEVSPELLEVMQTSLALRWGNLLSDQQKQLITSAESTFVLTLAEKLEIKSQLLTSAMVVIESVKCEDENLARFENALILITDSENPDNLELRKKYLDQLNSEVKEVIEKTLSSRIFNNALRLIPLVGKIQDFTSTLNKKYEEYAIELQKESTDQNKEKLSTIKSLITNITIKFPEEYPQKFLNLLEKILTAAELKFDSEDVSGLSNEHKFILKNALMHRCGKLLEPNCKIAVSTDTIQFFVVLGKALEVEQADFFAKAKELVSDTISANAKLSANQVTDRNFVPFQNALAITAKADAAGTIEALKLFCVPQFEEELKKRSSEGDIKHGDKDKAAAEIAKYFPQLDYLKLHRFLDSSDEIQIINEKDRKEVTNNERGSISSSKKQILSKEIEVRLYTQIAENLPKDKKNLMHAVFSIRCKKILSESPMLYSALQEFVIGLGVTLDYSVLELVAEIIKDIKVKLNTSQSLTFAQKNIFTNAVGLIAKLEKLEKSSAPNPIFEICRQDLYEIYQLQESNKSIHLNLLAHPLQLLKALAAQKPETENQKSLLISQFKTILENAVQGDDFKFSLAEYQNFSRQLKNRFLAQDAVEKNSVSTAYLSSLIVELKTKDIVVNDDPLFALMINDNVWISNKVLLEHLEALKLENTEKDLTKSFIAAAQKFDFEDQKALKEVFEAKYKTLLNRPHTSITPKIREFILSVGKAIHADLLSEAIKLVKQSISMPSKFQNALEFIIASENNDEALEECAESLVLLKYSSNTTNTDKLKILNDYLSKNEKLNSIVEQRRKSLDVNANFRKILGVLSGPAGVLKEKSANLKEDLSQEMQNFTDQQKNELKKTFKEKYGELLNLELSELEQKSILSLGNLLEAELLSTPVKIIQDAINGLISITQFKNALILIRSIENNAEALQACKDCLLILKLAETQKDAPSNLKNNIKSGVIELLEKYLSQTNIDHVNTEITADKQSSEINQKLIKLLGFLKCNEFWETKIVNHLKELENIGITIPDVKKIINFSSKNKKDLEKAILERYKILLSQDKAVFDLSEPVILLLSKPLGDEFLQSLKFEKILYVLNNDKVWIKDDANPLLELGYTDENLFVKDLQQFKELKNIDITTPDVKKIINFSSKNKKDLEKAILERYKMLLSQDKAVFDLSEPVILLLSEPLGDEFLRNLKFEKILYVLNSDKIWIKDDADPLSRLGYTDENLFVKDLQQFENDPDKKAILIKALENRFEKSSQRYDEAGEGNSSKTYHLADEEVVSPKVWRFMGLANKALGAKLNQNEISYRSMNVVRYVIAQTQEGKKVGNIHKEWRRCKNALAVIIANHDPVQIKECKQLLFRVLGYRYARMLHREHGENIRFPSEHEYMRGLLKIMLKFFPLADSDEEIDKTFKKQIEKQITTEIDIRQFRKNGSIGSNTSVKGNYPYFEAALYFDVIEKISDAILIWYPRENKASEDVKSRKALYLWLHHVRAGIEYQPKNLSEEIIALYQSIMNALIEYNKKPTNKKHLQQKLAALDTLIEKASESIKIRKQEIDAKKLQDKLQEQALDKIKILKEAIEILKTDSGDIDANRNLNTSIVWLKDDKTEPRLKVEGAKILLQFITNSKPSGDVLDRMSFMSLAGSIDEKFGENTKGLQGFYLAALCAPLITSKTIKEVLGDDFDIQQETHFKFIEQILAGLAEQPENSLVGASSAGLGTYGIKLQEILQEDILNKIKINAEAVKKDSKDRVAFEALAKNIMILKGNQTEKVVEVLGGILQGIVDKIEKDGTKTSDRDWLIKEIGFLFIIVSLKLDNSIDVESCKEKMGVQDFYLDALCASSNTNKTTEEMLGANFAIQQKHFDFIQKILSILSKQPTNSLVGVSSETLGTYGKQLQEILEEDILADIIKYADKVKLNSQDRESFQKLAENIAILNGNKSKLLGRILEDIRNHVFGKIKEGGKSTPDRDWLLSEIGFLIDCNDRANGIEVNFINSIKTCITKLKSNPGELHEWEVMKKYLNVLSTEEEKKQAGRVLFDFLSSIDELISKAIFLDADEKDLKRHVQEFIGKNSELGVYVQAAVDSKASQQQQPSQATTAKNSGDSISEIITQLYENIEKKPQSQPQPVRARTITPTTPLPPRPRTITPVANAQPKVSGANPFDDLNVNNPFLNSAYNPVQSAAAFVLSKLNSKEEEEIKDRFISAFNFSPSLKSVVKGKNITLKTVDTNCTLVELEVFQKEGGVSIVKLTPKVRDDVGAFYYEMQASSINKINNAVKIKEIEASIKTAVVTNSNNTSSVKVASALGANTTISAAKSANAMTPAAKGTAATSTPTSTSPKPQSTSTVVSNNTIDAGLESRLKNCVKIKRKDTRNFDWEKSYEVEKIREDFYRVTVTINLGEGKKREEYYGLTKSSDTTNVYGFDAEEIKKDEKSVSVTSPQKPSSNNPFDNFVPSSNTLTHTKLGNSW